MEHLVLQERRGEGGLSPFQPVAVGRRAAAYLEKDGVHLEMVVGEVQCGEVGTALDELDEVAARDLERRRERREVQRLQIGAHLGAKHKEETLALGENTHQHNQKRRSFLCNQATNVEVGGTRAIMMENL